jgi:hypothetical protein
MGLWPVPTAHSPLPSALDQPPWVAGAKWSGAKRAPGVPTPPGARIRAGSLPRSPTDPPHLTLRVPGNWLRLTNPICLSTTSSVWAKRFTRIRLASFCDFPSSLSPLTGAPLPVITRVSALPSSRSPLPSDIELSKIPGAQRAQREHTPFQPKFTFLRRKKQRDWSGSSGGFAKHGCRSRRGSSVRGAAGRSVEPGTWAG